MKVVLPTPFMTEVISSSTAAVTSPNRVIPYIYTNTLRVGIDHLIADLSESILEDPGGGLTDAIGGVVNGEEEAGEEGDKKTPLYRKTPSKLHKLLDLASLVDNGHDAHAARLGLLSLMAIFQDILPTNRIRLPTESEMQVRLSKETKATWDHERRLLQCYQRYLQLLERNGKWVDLDANGQHLTKEERIKRGGMRVEVEVEDNHPQRYSGTLLTPSYMLQFQLS